MTKNIPKNLTQLKAAPYNPRAIKDQAFEGLKHSLTEYGDLSGIVFNIRTKHLVAGHQRVTALRKEFGNLVIANGKITTKSGETFPVRYVDWELQKEKLANLAANSPTIQGVFTADVQSLLDELRLESTGEFEALQLEGIYALPFDLTEEFEYISEAEDITSNNRQTIPDAERAEGYLSGETKKFEFYIEKQDYDRFVEKLKEIKIALKIETNSDLFLRLVLDY
ncbi:MAG TPA: hypothetical protein VFO76_12875 [Candidatus Kapabacteria bacterium]|nr:hypothetical protein [Candidatus Kapabacteria bacterium]